MSHHSIHLHIHTGISPDELRQELVKLHHLIKEDIMATKKDVEDAIAANRAASAAETAKLSAKVDLVIKLLNDARNGGGATPSDLDAILAKINEAGTADVAGDAAVEGTLDSALTSGKLATLSMILVSVGSLAPAFDPAVLSYNVSEAADVTSVMFAPTPSDPSATVTVNGAPTPAGQPSAPVTVATGDNSVPIVVTSADGSVTSTYTVVVTVAAAA